MGEPRVVILGAGPAGVGAAWRLRETGRAAVTVVEQRDAVGGNAGSFEVEGQRVDYGSHRLHPACDAAILEDIRRLLPCELVTRPRHGRIRLLGRWIHFPLQPVDLALRLDPAFALGSLKDAVARAVGRGPDPGDTFASVLRAGLGPTISDHFYLPYARKIWGVDPETLSAEQARRRVAAGSFGKLLRKVFGRLPGVPESGFRHFHYPADGFGAISEGYADAAVEAGAELLLGWRVVGLERDGDGWRVAVERDGERRILEADLVWSTIPIAALPRLVEAPDAVAEAARSMASRAMLLVYLTLDLDRFSGYDAHYLPDPAVAPTRVSEPKNYHGGPEPRGRTTLCAEMPCDTADAVWTMADADLGRRVADDLAKVGIPLPRAPVAVTVRRLGHAYPIYHAGYEAAFDALDAWASDLPGFLTFGRQGLFAHDNTHHALAMAYAAVECLGPDRRFDDARWAAYRTEFESHVVED